MVRMTSRRSKQFKNKPRVRSELNDEAQVRAWGIERNLENLDRLLTATRHPDSKVQVMACRAIGWLKDERAQPHLLDLLGHRNSKVRNSAVASLALCGNDMSAEALIASLESDPSDQVRSSAARVLGWLGLAPARPNLIKALQTATDARVRAEAVCALGRLGVHDIHDLRIIIDAVQDDSAVVRAHALRALSRLGIAMPMARFKALLGDSDPEVRVVTLRVLSQLEVQGALELIRTCLSDENPGVRSAAVISLAHLNDPRAIAMIEGLIEDTHPEVRHHVRQALDKLKS